MARQPRLSEAPTTTAVYNANLTGRTIAEPHITWSNQIENDSGYPLPDFVIKEFDEYQRCGLPCYYQ